jgi:hypothetical protein
MWVGAFCLLGVTLLALVEIQRWRDVAALQDVVESNYQITLESDDRPALLPEFIDAAVFRYLKRFNQEPGEGPSHTQLYGDSLHDRFRALFRGPIRKIEIHYPDGTRGDMGAALQRFPRLRRVMLDGASGMTESEFKVLCGQLRQLSNLKELTFIGMPATDAALAELAGHPRLRSITIILGNFTTKSAKTFASMPALRQLVLDGEAANGDPSLAPEIAKEMGAALPGVAIRSP